MNIPILTEEDIRRIFREELQRFSTSISAASARTEEDELVDSKEAARILGCTTRTLASYRSRRLISVTFLGPHKAMYWKSELEAFLAAHTRPSRNTK